MITMPRIGDSLLNADGIPWLIDLARGSPWLDAHDLNQVAALLLGSHLKIDGMIGCSAQGQAASAIECPGQNAVCAYTGFAAIDPL
jgi:hypothetical protein